MTSVSARRASRALRTFEVVRSILLNFAAVIGVLSILLVVITLASGLRPLVVISGSMEPGIPTGSLILTPTVPASELAVGDVVTVPRPDGLGPVTHRIIAIEPAAEGGTQLKLQGDANASPDPQPSTVAEAGLLQFTVPYLGAVVQAVRSPLGLAGIGIFLIGLVVLYFVGPSEEDAK
ncbi:signal peptidase I [Leucobacter sp. USCH14]|uniref:signal peptidase I n=1 Tax=Leucobacter sp. USCH14 TaxID=3024838 RepID=UPI0030A0982B